MQEYIKKHFINLRGVKLGEKVLVIESDDWGSIRTPNNKAKEHLIEKKLLNAKDSFTQYDTLETDLDFEHLLETFSKHKDIHGNSPVITTNTILANPNFDKIKEDKYEKYTFETFSTTYKNQSQSQNAFELFKQGIGKGILYPQFHGREHLNVPMWLKLLQNNNQHFIESFNLGCFSINYTHPANKRNNLMASYDYQNDEELEFIEQSIAEGLSLFESIFGFKSLSNISPCYVWDESIEKTLFNNGVKFIQGSRFQQKPQPNSKKFKRIFHYNGEKNKLGQYYFQRNVLFEPSLNKSIDWVAKAMESISIAFSWNKPAIIGSHRINFTGGLNEQNRINNLKLFEDLFNQIQKKWPDVAFISSADLHQIYYKTNS